METEQAAEILLVRAIEESGEVALSPELQVDAFEAAGDLDDERGWLARRASHLLQGPYSRFRALRGMWGAVQPPILLNFALPFLVGLASNYLGPREQIHVLYNPIGLLIAWNLGIYLVLGARRLVSARTPARQRAASTGDMAPAPTNAGSGPPEPRKRGGPRVGGWLLRRALAGLWLRVHRGVAGAREDAKTFTKIGARFWKEWEAAARPIFEVGIRRVLHLAAAGMALGAVAGMFVRGLFFEYEMVWRSTFIGEPETVASLLRLALGPASLLLRWPLPAVDDAQRLMGEAGVGAAPWIELWALTALLFVVIPRALLASFAAHRARRMGASIDLHLSDPYYAEVLSEARERRVDWIKGAIRTDVRIECGKFAEAVSIFVVERLYDARVAPCLREFRETGGRLADLEARIQSESRSFEGELQAYIPQAQQEFEESLSRAVVAKAGRELSVPGSLSRRFGAVFAEIPGGSVGEISSAMSSEFARPVVAAVTASVATGLGVAGGGFGESIGVAILATLFGTTGPVGFVIGALGGVVAAGAMLWLGKDRMKGALMNVKLPPRVAKMVVPTRRLQTILASGREQCRDSTKALMLEALDPATDEISDQIWVRVKALIAGRGAAEVPGQP